MGKFTKKAPRFVNGIKQKQFENSVEESSLNILWNDKIIDLFIKMNYLIAHSTNLSSDRAITSLLKDYLKTVNQILGQTNLYKERSSFNDIDYINEYQLSTKSECLVDCLKIYEGVKLKNAKVAESLNKIMFSMGFQIFPGLSKLDIVNNGAFSYLFDDELKLLSSVDAQECAKFITENNSDYRDSDSSSSSDFLQESHKLGISFWGESTTKPDYSEELPDLYLNTFSS